MFNARGSGHNRAQILTSFRALISEKRSRSSRISRIPTDNSTPVCRTVLVREAAWPEMNPRSQVKDAGSSLADVLSTPLYQSRNGYWQHQGGHMPFARAGSGSARRNWERPISCSSLRGRSAHPVDRDLKALPMLKPIHMPLCGTPRWPLLTPDVERHRDGHRTAFGLSGNAGALPHKPLSLRTADGERGPGRLPALSVTCGWFSGVGSVR